MVDVRANGMTLHEPKFIRKIGLMKDRYQLTVFDPQLRPLLAPGVKADLLIELDPNGSGAAAAGEFPAVVYAWKPKAVKNK
jgi:hypothetical protein